MKKLILLLASMAVVVSCSKPNNGSIPNPDDGKPRLNESAVKVKFSQLVTFEVLNYSGDVTWSAENDENARIGEDGVMQAFAIGETNIVATLADTVLKCKVTVEPTAKECVFKNPLLTFGADTAAIKAAETRDYDESIHLGNRDTTILVYIDDDVTTEYIQLYQYYVQNVAASGSDQTGMFKAVVTAATDSEDELDTFFASFGERAYFIGALNDYVNVFTNRKVNPEYSIMTSSVYLDNERTLFGFVCEFVPQVKWNAASQYEMLKASISGAKLTKKVLPFNAATVSKYSIARK